MHVDRVLYPITSLGPGERLVIWTIGCSKQCPKCANPELWRKNPDKDVDVTNFVQTIKQATGNREIDGITITGGDPLEQIAELNKLLVLLKEITNDILVYTGYTLEEAEKNLPQPDMETLKSHVSVLIDGRYMDGLNDNQCVLKGSSNQNIIYFDETKKEPYEAYIQQGRSVQNVFYNTKMISVGIHNRDLVQAEVTGHGQC